MSVLANFFRLVMGDKQVGVQNPFPVDGDSVYVKDVNTELSDITGFTGKVTDPFDDLHSENLDDSASAIKTFFIHFQRTIITPLVGIGSSEGNTFSNVKVIGVLSGGIETVLSDHSSDNTDRPTQFFSFPNAGLNALKIEFHTTDAIGITNIYIPKLAIIAAVPETPIVFAASYKSPYLTNVTFDQDMAQAGSLGVPIDFEYEVTGNSPARWTRSFIDLQDGAQDFQPDDFGALAALVNGVQIIVEKDGVEYVMETWNSNMDISMTCYDFSAPYKAGAYIGRWTILSDLNAPITLFPGDKIICRIRDTLTGLDAFRFRIKLKQ